MSQQPEDAKEEKKPGEAAKPRRAFLLLELHGPRLALGIVALGLALRLSGFFGWWLNPDEGIYYSTVTQPSSDAFWTEVGFQAHPPLYFMILRGVGYLTQAFEALRLVALLSGCAAIYVFVLVGRELGMSGMESHEGGRREQTDGGAGSRGAGGGEGGASGTGSAAGAGWLVGLTSGLLLALSPRAIAQSQLIRPYMFLVAVLSGALYLLLRYLRQPRPILLVGYAVCATTAVLTHYSALLALGAMGLLVMVDGARGGFTRPAWLRLLAAQVAPAVAVVALYLTHLRRLMGLAGAENAQQGWLGGYMIRDVGDVWLSMMGFHSMLAGETLAPTAALLTLAGLVLAVRRRAWTALTPAGGGLLLAGVAAAAVLYPFGATRHTSWLLVFVTPLLAWTLVAMFSSGRRRASIWGAALVVSGLASVAFGGFLGADRMPPEISEHVLQQGHVEAMGEVLDPQAPPRVVFMSTETYQLLTPLYAAERESARWSSDGVLLHFVWGSRHVVVLPTRDFTVRPEEVGYPNHLFTAARKATVDFPEIGLPDADTILVLAGGWRSQGMADLAEMGEGPESLGSATGVPGLIAVELDTEAYFRALSMERGPPDTVPDPGGGSG